MLKPELNNFATQFSENFRSVFEDFSVDFSFIYFVFHSFILFSVFLSSLEGPMIIYCFFYQARSAQKVFQEL